jgi:CheY-like chemotaxis protein
MEEESKVGVYSIAAVSEAVGLPQSTLRHWERAYGLIKPVRTAGGHRLYSEADIDRLKWLKHKTVDEGMKSGAAHRLLERQLTKLGKVTDEASSRGAVMILVAEKDPITAELEEYFLKQQGFAVHIVLDGRLAVEEATRLQPDLIILDMILPGLSGIKVCTALKSRPETSHIPVLVFSVLDVRDRALAAGADAFLLKPIEQPKLIDSVKNLLVQGSRDRRDRS